MFYSIVDKNIAMMLLWSAFLLSPLTSKAINHHVAVVWVVWSLHCCTTSTLRRWGKSRFSVLVASGRFGFFHSHRCCTPWLVSKHCLIVLTWWFEEMVENPVLLDLQHLGWFGCCLKSCYLP